MRGTTTSILNLGFKNNCAKNIGAYNMHKIDTEIHTNISSKKSSKTYCKIKLAELTAKS